MYASHVFGPLSYSRPLAAIVRLEGKWVRQLVSERMPLITVTSADDKSRVDISGPDCLQAYRGLLVASSE
jgi:hypothetical protein